MLKEVVSPIATIVVSIIISCRPFVTSILVGILGIRTPRGPSFPPSSFSLLQLPLKSSLLQTPYLPRLCSTYGLELCNLARRFKVLYPLSFALSVYLL